MNLLASHWILIFKHCCLLHWICRRINIIQGVIGSLKVMGHITGIMNDVMAGER
jgi:hypothetical protein